MGIDSKLLIPLMGVFLGWVLATITNIFKVRGENKKLLGKSIAQLYYLISELSIVLPYLDKMKDRLSIEQYEIHRQKVIERHTLKNENSNTQIDELTENISSLYPILGIELKYLLEGYISDRKIKLNSAKTHKDLYDYLLSAIEVVQDITLDKMEKMLITLAFRYNIFTGFKIKRQLKNRKKNLEREGQKIFDNFQKEINERINIHPTSL